MCGILGSANTLLDDRDVLLVNHRGPDYRSLIEIDLNRNRIFLGHTRLAILDLSDAGNQPMVSECGNYFIAFNGEIYNHLELRKNLREVNFKGCSDTETILNYLKKYGIDAVKEFNGIFAFAFVDKAKEKIYLARDHFGVKPLYYFVKNNRLLFASEIKVLLNNAAYKKDIDVDSLDTFLTLRYNPSPQTFFKDIKKLQSAHYLEFAFSENIKITNYWRPTPQINNDIKEQEAVLEYKKLVTQAVKRQLLSDVPVGLLLSGGIDSAVLGHLMSKTCHDTINTFTVGFDGVGDHNELDNAKATAEFIGSKHHELVIEKDEYLNFLYKSYYYTEEPIAEPTIPALYYVSKLASNYVKVVLSGQGLDEIMAGYNRYRGEKLISHFQLLLRLLPLKFISKMLADGSFISRGIYASDSKDILSRFIGIYTIFTPDLKKKLIKKEYMPLHDDEKNLFSKIYDQTHNLKDSLSKLLYVDARTMLPDNLLLFNDKMTMANSLENRVPYLDIDLVNFIETLPVKYKLNGQANKYLHRKASEEWLPPSIIGRKKLGFLTPISSWLKGDFLKLLLELTHATDSFSRLYFNVDFIDKMISMHKNKIHNYKTHLFIILSLELWYRNFYMNTEIGSTSKGNSIIKGCAFFTLMPMLQIL